MKWLQVLFCLLYIHTFGQSVSYSNRTSRLYVTDQVVVIPDVGGNRHLLVYTPGEAIRLQIFDKQLQWVNEQKLSLKLSENSDITILPFSKEYYLYNQGEAGNGAYLWKINSEGNVVDQTSRLKNIIRTSFKDTTVLCQLFSSDTSLYVMGNSYFPGLKKIVTTIVKTNSRFERPVIQHYAFNFDHTKEGLQKIIVIPGRDLIVLKRQVTENMEYVLEILKIKLNSSRIYSTAFNMSAPYFYPDVVYNPHDSSAIILAQLPRSVQNYKLTRNLFTATVNDTLEQKDMPIITKVLIRDEMYGAFTCINTGNSNKWIAVHGNWNYLYNPRISYAPRALVGLSRMVSLQRSITILNATSFQPKLQPIHPAVQYVTEPGDVRFTVVDNRYQSIQDTIIKYHRRTFIEVGQYASFNRDSDNYLLVKEQFPSKGKSLLLLHLNKDGKLDPIPLSLYERYHYSLPQLQQTSEGNIIMPYIYKSEVGLVSIDLSKRE